MHINKITQIEVAKKLGVTNDYISLILRGKKTPKGASERILTAIDDIIKERK
jgi:transcriptional regulator with XRE-family HTH domain